MTFFPNNCRIDSLKECLQLPVDVLRLDLFHPVVSGNKWFKLKAYLQEADERGQTGLVTFGGAYSNHIVATAAAANTYKMESIGLIRGERPSKLSNTLMDAENFGMKLHFLSRSDYAEKKIPPSIIEDFAEKDFAVIPEGGYGLPGMTGAKDILANIELEHYSHVVTAVGTGTTLAGLVSAALPYQEVIGIPVLKNAGSINNEVNALLPAEKKNQFSMFTDYHFGGYAKKTEELIMFMNDFYRRTSVPTDFVYTGKTFFAVLDLFRRDYFSIDNRVLVIHTGGLQGNRSLSKGTLIFD